jgi:hypothetical protein
MTDPEANLLAAAREYALFMRTPNMGDRESNERYATLLRALNRAARELDAAEASDPEVRT